MRSNVPLELQQFSEQPFRQLATNRCWHQAAINRLQHDYFPLNPSFGLLAIYRIEFIATGRERRRRGSERMAIDSALALPFVALQKGPFAVPREAFSQEVWDRLPG